MATFRQGDTTTITMTSDVAIGDDKKIKAGIYSMSGKPLFETTYPDDGLISKIDSTHFALELDYYVTRKLAGATTFRVVIYTNDKQLVNAGENAIVVNWSSEPSTKELK